MAFALFFVVLAYNLGPNVREFVANLWFVCSAVQLIKVSKIISVAKIVKILQCDCAAA